MTSSSGHTIASGDQGSSSTVPRISAISDRGLRNDDPGADAVAGAAAAEDMREPLAEPPLHAALGHEDQLFGERIGQRVASRVAEPVGEQVGALSAVKVKPHRGPP